MGGRQVERSGAEIIGNELYGEGQGGFETPRRKQGGAQSSPGEGKRAGNTNNGEPSRARRRGGGRPDGHGEGHGATEKKLAAPPWALTEQDKKEQKWRGRFAHQKRHVAERLAGFTHRRDITDWDSFFSRHRPPRAESTRGANDLMRIFLARGQVSPSPSPLPPPLTHARRE